MKRQFTPFILKNPEDTKSVVTPIEDVVRNGKDSVWSEPEELYALYELAFGLHNNPSTEGYVIEFGSYRGGSTCVMGKAIRNSRTHYRPLFAVDPYPKNSPSDYAYVISRENYHRLDLTYYICPVICNCLEFLNFWTLPIRFAFLDASHKYELTKQEISAIMPHIVNDGWLVCDDYEEEDWTQVIPALNKFIDTQTEYDLEIFQIKAHVCLHIIGRK